MAVDKFVMLGWARTGSTAMEAILRAHPDLSFRGEVFRDYSVEYVGPMSFHSLDLLFDKADGFRFMSWWIPEEVDCLFRYSEQSKLRFMILWRRNVLKAVVSESICMRSNVWEGLKVRRLVRGSASLGAIPLDEIERSMEYRVGKFEEAKAVLTATGAEWKVFCYEDLFSGPLSDRIANLSGVFRFIGVEPLDDPEIVDQLNPDRKHLPAGAYGKIENVDEIEKRFAPKHGSLFS
jgi:hypothetical protein